MSNGRPELCVGAVSVDEDCLLLVRRGTDPGRGLWSVPGGRVEAGESIVSAVIRELREETNLEGVCGPLIGWVERIEGSYHFVILDFSVTILGRRRGTAGGDAAEVAWHPLKDLHSVALVPGLFEFLVDHGVIPETSLRIL